MSQYTSYYLYQKYQKIGTGDWTPVTPSVFSIDGEGTMPLSAKTEYDPNCGYNPPIEPTYRWVNMDISTDWVCDDCPTPPTPPTPEYRTVSTAFTCVGYDKHYLDEYQVSYDSGATWTTLSSSTGSLAEAHSEYCGYVPIPTGTKFYATYSGGDTYSGECGSSKRLSSADTKPSGYQYTEMTGAIIGNCVSAVTGYTFSGFTSLTSIDIPDSVTSIGMYAFRGCRSLTDIKLPSGVTYIDSNTFAGCTGLTSINILGDVTYIGEKAFSSCSSLTSIDLPDSLTSFGPSAFTYCTNITSITLPSNVSVISNSAFRYCSGLTSITCLATTPPRLGGNVFDGSTCPIYLPASSVETYKSASGWSTYASRITAIPNS